MGKRVSVAVCLSFGAALGLGIACASIPDSRKLQPEGWGTDAGDGGGSGADGGSTGGKAGSGGAATGGTGGGAGAGGATGGGSGAGGTTATDGGGGSDGGRSILCGAVACSDRQVGTALLTACCAGTTKDHCGFESGALGTSACLEVNQIGSYDTSCTDFTVGTTVYKGCCRTSGSCGVMVEPPGGPHFGCVDASATGVSTTSTCTPPSCGAAGTACSSNSDCCAGRAGTGACVTFTGAAGATCSEYCVTNADCGSGCCVTLVSGRGVCAPDASSCSAKCRLKDETCDKDSDCCAGAVCAPNSDIGPRLCRPLCTTDMDCSPEFCVASGGRSTCSTTGAGLCTNTCSAYLDNGVCDDGGPGADSYGSCALGSDCRDCATVLKTNGVRLGGTTSCSNTCATSKNNQCEDGGTNSVGSSCGFGTDCADCGPRLGICANSCPSANDGYCDDGGAGAKYDVCTLGTDCVDCGIRFGGRGQTPCDGSNGYLCNPSGLLFSPSHFADGACDCPDCAWDSGSHDCNRPTRCDGKSISTCCAPGNPCNFDGDGVCDCGGWCDWEKTDCGPGATGARCDGVTLGSSCDFKNPGVPDQYCDCYGACSWEGADCANLGLICQDTCQGFVNNGTCDDGGTGSSSARCMPGTDCADCGPR